MFKSMPCKSGLLASVVLGLSGHSAWLSAALKIIATTIDLPATRPKMRAACLSR